jgi:putative phage-type endonuclease
MDRTGYIGASDVPVILGVNPCKTPHQLWLEKTGQVAPPDISQNSAVKFGEENEAKVGEIFSMLHDIPLRDPQNKQYTSDRLECLKVRPDFMIEDKNIPVEIKCVGRLEKWFINKTLPDYYEAQIRAQMAALGADVAWVCAMDRTHRHIYNQKLFLDLTYEDLIFKTAEKFWNCVEKEEPPKR